MSSPGGPDELGKGQRLGKYEILTRLSVGGMAEIFLCFVAGPGGFRKFVTVKRILPDLREEEDFLDMFLDEARITAALSHSNIAQVFDLGQEDGELFIAMEFIPGQDLARVLRACRKLGRRLPAGFGARVIHDVCLALQYANHFTDGNGKPSPIIHRDISPKNIMVTYAGNVKVIDFGIAKARDRLSGTEAGQLKGSARYMSPEQVRGEALGGQSDLFSAGVVLHELLTGTSVFNAQTQQAMLAKILNAPIPAPHELDPNVPLELSEVTMRAMEREPGRRFASGLHMARALEAAAGTALFDDAQLSEVMRELFQETIEKTFALLESPSLDTGRLKHAAGELREVSPSSSDVQRGTDTLPTRPLDLIPRQVKAATGQAHVILGVDDSATMRGFLEKSLVYAGYRFEGASSPRDALERVGRESFDLIILDVMMPEMDGFELCRRIRELPTLAYVPILFLSAACSVEERVKGLSVGADDFIRKPCDPAELVARVRMHLQRIEMLRQMSSANRQVGA
jgi:serine/threonine protein kinase